MEDGYPGKLNSDIHQPLYFADGNQLRSPTKRWLEGAGGPGFLLGVLVLPTGVLPAPRPPLLLLPVQPCHIPAPAWHRLGVVVAGGRDLEPLHGHLRQEGCSWGGRRDVPKE